MRALGFTNLDFLTYVPAECVHPESTFYTKLVIKTIGPIIICALLWLPVLCVLVLKLHQNVRDKRNTRRKDKLDEQLVRFRTSAISVSLLFLEISLPSISSTIAQAFMCEEIGGERYLSAHLTMSCEPSSNRVWWESYASVMIFGTRSACRR